MAASREHLLNVFEHWLLDTVVNDESFTYDMYYDFMDRRQLGVLTKAQFRHYLPRVVEKYRRFGWAGPLTPFARVSRWTESESVFTDRNQMSDMSWNTTAWGESGEARLAPSGSITRKTDEYVGQRTWTVYYVETQPDPDLHPREFAEWKNSLL